MSESSILRRFEAALARLAHVGRVEAVQRSTDNAYGLVYERTRDGLRVGVFDRRIPDPDYAAGRIDVYVRAVNLGSIVDTTPGADGVHDASRFHSSEEERQRQALAAAVQRGQNGIDAAAAHAESIEPAWTRQAGELLLGYARKVGRGFLIEHARAWCYAQGLPQPPDERAWGAATQYAARQRPFHLQKTGGEERAASSNATEKPLWALVDARIPTLDLERGLRVVRRDDLIPGWVLTITGPDAENMMRAAFSRPGGSDVGFAADNNSLRGALLRELQDEIERLP